MKPEILAPAQDMEALRAAVQAGADSIYVGLQELSARQRGKNFTLPALSEAITYCHKNGIKLYVAINTVIKEKELPVFIKYVSAIAAQKADGIIVQDLGAARLIHCNFPDLLMHASTQLAVHNLEGVFKAAQLGFKRVILARELNHNEVKKIASLSPIELEVFVHGSYCFSFSGVCLASSFLGGFSGNRGWCTQACRRPYLTRGKYKYLFSMADLSMVKKPEILRSLPVAAWKIEGRMKYPEYVKNTVMAYRLIREGKEDKIGELISSVKTRVFTSGYLGMVDVKELTSPNRPGFAGIFLGRVKRANKDSIELKLSADIRSGQKLRIQATETEKGRSFRIKWIETHSGKRSPAKKVQQAKKGTLVGINALSNSNKGDLVFLVDQKRTRFRPVHVTPPPWQRHANRFEKKLAEYLQKKIKTETPGRGDNTLTLETDDPAVARSTPKHVDRLLLLLNDRLLHELSPAFIKKIPTEVGISLPPVILPEKTREIREVLTRLNSYGITIVEINNIGGWNLLPKGTRVQTGPYLYVHNHLAAGAMLTEGSERIVFPLEGDIKTLKSISEKGLAPYLEVVLYGCVPLFISRAEVKTKGSRSVKDSHEDSFLLKGRDGLTYVWGLRPYCAFSFRQQLQALGIRHFRISAIGRKHAASQIPWLVNRYRRSKDLDGSMSFNLETGLK